MKIAPYLQNLNYQRAIGGRGANNGAFAITRAFLDMPFVIPSSWSGIYVPFFSCGSADNAAATPTEIYLCPESERDNATATLAPSSNVSNPVPFQDTKWFLGTAISVGNATGTAPTSKYYSWPITKPLFVPYGYFLRVLQFAVAAQANSVCWLSMYYSYSQELCVDISL